MRIQENTENRHFKGLSRGFSLFEMVIVMGIIGVILGGSIYAMRNIGNTAKIKGAEGDFTSFMTNLDAYKLLARRYPTQQQGLEALIRKPSSSPVPKKWTKTLNNEDALLDPWGNKYQYKFPGSKEPNLPEILSAGPDGQFGGEDDLSSQE